jgi:hypothetical protein
MFTFLAILACVVFSVFGWAVGYVMGVRAVEQALQYGVQTKQIVIAKGEKWNSQ